MSEALAQNTPSGFRWQAAALWAVVTLFGIGLPTDIIPNPVFGREVPVRAWELPVLVVTALLTGAWFGLQRWSSEPTKGSAPVVTGAGLAMFAVACPVCNKIILLLLGTSGALGLWQPIQPYVAALSLVWLAAAVAWAWWRRPCSGGTCTPAGAVALEGQGSNSLQPPGVR